MKNGLFCFSLLLILQTQSVWSQEIMPRASVVERPSLNHSNIHYTGNKAPLLPISFIKLPPGSIRPSGWIRKYLDLQKAGLTGHLSEISAWLDKKNNAWFSGNGEGDHGWEEVPYWLKGYGDLGYVLQDTAIIKETKSWLEKVFKSQRQDGYFGPRVIDSGHPNNSPDLWPNMLMLFCMQSYYEYSGEVRVIDFMTRYFKWEYSVPDSNFLKTYWENSRGGDNLYSVYWLYNRTGKPWLLELANKIHRNTANWMQSKTLPNWHNVNIAQSFREPATYYQQSADSSNMDASYNDFRLVRALYGQVPGGMFGADENARKGYADPRQAIETCGMVEQMASDEMLIGITGDPLWADNCEDVAFNSYPAATMPDFRSLRYLTAPNMVLSDSKNHSPGIQNEGPFLMMNPFSSRCCQHNHSQGWPYYAEHLWMATPDNGLAAILYGANECTAKAGNRDGGTVTLRETTHYPFSDTVQFELHSAKAIEFPLYLRIPSWCTGASVSVNGKEIEIHAPPGSYILLENKWKNGDHIVLILPMQLTKRAWSQNKNSVSINYGPLSFSLRIDEYYKQMDSRKSAIADSKWQPDADPSKWPAFEIYPAGFWNYGLALKDTELQDQFIITRRPWPADDYPFAQGSVPIILKAKGKLIPEWMIDQYGLCGLLPESPVLSNMKEQEIELIPMGAARLRISAFPVVK